MTRRLLLSYVSITVFVLVVLELPLGLTYARNERDRLISDLDRDARVLATVVEDSLEGSAALDAQRVADDYATRTGARVVVVDSQGFSIADSDGSPAGRDFSTRPEITDALAADSASGTRYSETLGEHLVYVAVPVASGGRVLGAVRLTYPRAELDDRVARNWLTLGALAAVVIAAVVAVGTVLARSVTRPVRSLRRAADALAQGELDARAPVEGGSPELRSLAESFNHMAVRVEQLIGVQRAFVGDASHELRAPLTALRLRLENLEIAAHSDQERDALDAAGQEVARLSNLVDELLQLARTEAMPGVPRRVDLAGEVRERLAAWRAFADEQRVALVYEAPARADVLAVPDAIPQVVDNLLSNAFDAAPAGSEIAVHVTPIVAGTLLSIVDHGRGMSAEQRERAFDRFWRAPDAQRGGSGLGLAIVAQLVSVSGGSIELRPGPDGRGTAAVVTFPNAPAAPLPADRAEPIVSGAVAEGRPRR